MSRSLQNWPWPYWLERQVNASETGGIPYGNIDILFPFELALSVLVVFIALTMAACVADQHHRWWRMVGRAWGMQLRDAEARKRLREGSRRCGCASCPLPSASSCAKRPSNRVVPAAAAATAATAAAGLDPKGGGIEMTAILEVLPAPVPKIKDLQAEALKSYRTNHLKWVESILEAVEGPAAAAAAASPVDSEESDEELIAAAEDAAADAAASSAWHAAAHTGTTPLDLARVRVVEARDATLALLGEERGRAMWHSVALDPLAFDADTRSFMREAVNAFADVRLHEAAAVDRIREEAHAAELILMQHVLRRRYRAAACKACASHAFGFACHWCATFARRLTLDHVHVDALASLSLLACCCCSPQRHCPRRPALTPRRNRRVALQLTALGVLLAMAINVAALTQFEQANAWWRLARAFIRSNATQTSVEGLGVAPLTAVVETIATQMPEVLPYDSNEIGLYVSVFVSTAVVGLLSWWLSAVENEYKCGCGSCIRASRLLRGALAPLEDAAVAGKEVAVAVKENVVVATPFPSLSLAAAAGASAAAASASLPAASAAAAPAATTVATTAAATTAAATATAAPPPPTISGMPAPQPHKTVSDITEVLSVGDVTAIGLGVGGALANERARRKLPPIDDLVPAWGRFESDESSSDDDESSTGMSMSSTAVSTVASTVASTVTSFASSRHQVQDRPTTGNSVGWAGIASLNSRDASKRSGIRPMSIASRFSRPERLVHGEHLLGLEVQKKFASGMFDGEVTEVYPGLPGVDPLYRVMYTDGEEEDFELHELDALLLQQAVAEVRAATVASMRPDTAPLDVQPRSALCESLLTHEALFKAEQFEYEANPIYDPSALLTAKIIRKSEDVSVEDGAFVKQRDGWNNGTVLLRPAAKHTGVTVWTFQIEQGKRMTIGLARADIPLDNFLNHTNGGWGIYQYSGRIGHAGPADTPYCPSFRCTDGTLAAARGATTDSLGLPTIGGGGAIVMPATSTMMQRSITLSGEKPLNEIRMEFDADVRTLSFVVNGVPHGVAFTSVPSAVSTKGELEFTEEDQSWKIAAAKHATEVVDVANAAVVAAMAAVLKANAAVMDGQKRWAGVVDFNVVAFGGSGNNSGSGSSSDSDEDDDKDDSENSSNDDDESKEGSGGSGSNSDSDDDDGDGGDGDDDESNDSGDDSEDEPPAIPAAEIAAVDGGPPLYAAITLAHAFDRVVVLAGDSDETLLLQRPVVFDGSAPMIDVVMGLAAPPPLPSVLAVGGDAGIGNDPDDGADDAASVASDVSDDASEKVPFADAQVPIAEPLYLAEIEAEVLTEFPLRDVKRERRWRQHRRCVACCATTHALVALTLIIDAVALIGYVRWTAVGVLFAAAPALAFALAAFVGCRASATRLRNVPATNAVQFMVATVGILCVLTPYSALDYRWGEMQVRAVWDTAYMGFTTQQHASEAEASGAAPVWPPATWPPSTSDPTTLFGLARWPARYLAHDLQTTWGCCGFSSPDDHPLSLPCPLLNASGDLGFYVAPAAGLIRMIAERVGYEGLTNASTADCRASTKNVVNVHEVPGCFPILRCYARHEMSTLSTVTGLADFGVQLGLDYLQDLLSSTPVAPYIAMVRPYLSLAGFWTGSPQLVLLLLLEIGSFIAVVQLLLYPPFLGAPREKAKCRGICGCDCWPQGCCLTPWGCHFKQCGDDTVASFGDDDGTSDAAAEHSKKWAKFRICRCWCDRDDVEIARAEAERKSYAQRSCALCARRWRRVLSYSFAAILALAFTLLALAAVLLFGIDDFDEGRWLQLVVLSTALSSVVLLGVVALSACAETACASRAACVWLWKSARVRIPIESASVGIDESGSTAKDNTEDNNLNDDVELELEDYSERSGDDAGSKDDEDDSRPETAALAVSERSTDEELDDDDDDDDDDDVDGEEEEEEEEEDGDEEESEEESENKSENESESDDEEEEEEEEEEE